MTPKRNDTPTPAERQATIHELLQQKMRMAIRSTLITVCCTAPIPVVVIDHFDDP
jgi:hypothetical protein